MQLHMCLKAQIKYATCLKVTLISVGYREVEIWCLAEYRLGGMVPELVPPVETLYFGKLLF